MTYKKLILTAAAALLLTSCVTSQFGIGTQPAPPALVRLEAADIPALIDKRDPAALAESVGNSVKYYSTVPKDKTYTFGSDVRNAAQMLDSMSRFRELLLSGPSEDLIARYVQENFDVYASTGADGTGSVLFTGYYTPELAASPVMDDAHKFPVYSVPADMLAAELGDFKDKLKGEKIVGMVKDNKFVPYYSRKEIDEGGALTGKGLELAWCANPIEIFFLQVQGSGLLAFPDGSRRHINYRGANGRAYRSIGKLLIDQGKVAREQMSMEALKNYLREHPAELREILDYNESYVFFALEDDGPFGCLGVPVTGERSIATDSSIFPQGALAFIDTQAPSRSGAEVPVYSPYNGFFMNQDTGGAIKGPGRVDVFFGTGDEAEFRAGWMKNDGKLYMLAPKVSAQ